LLVTSKFVPTEWVSGILAAPLNWQTFDGTFLVKIRDLKERIFFVEQEVFFVAQAIVIDTLAYAKKLIAVGVPEKQAEVQAETLAEIVNENLATKQDLKALETTLKRDIKELEMRLIIRLGAMLTISIAIVATLVKLL
jgi:hypothetical protein